MLRWIHGVCFSLWWRRFVGGSLYLYDVEGSTRSCWTGSWVSPCAILLRRVGFWVAACCGYCSPLGMTCQWARSPLEERVYRGAGRSRRRARGDGVLVWSGVAVPCLCGGSFLGLFSRERGSDAVALSPSKDETRRREPPQRQGRATPLHTSTPSPRARRRDRHVARREYTRSSSGQRAAHISYLKPTTSSHQKNNTRREGFAQRLTKDPVQQRPRRPLHAIERPAKEPSATKARSRRRVPTATHSARPQKHERRAR